MSSARQKTQARLNALHRRRWDSIAARMLILGRGDPEAAQEALRSLRPPRHVARLKADIQKWDFTHFIMDRCRSVTEGLRSKVSFFDSLPG